MPRTTTEVKFRRVVKLAGPVHHHASRFRAAYSAQRSVAQPAIASMLLAIYLQEIRKC